jgi:hypothetical protein
MGLEKSQPNLRHVLVVVERVIRRGCLVIPSVLAAMGPARYHMSRSAQTAVVTAT